MVSLEEDINKNFREDVRDYQNALELYGALCNMRWDHEDFDEPESMSWRYAGGVIADMRNDLFQENLLEPESDLCAHCGKSIDDHIETEVPYPPIALELMNKIEGETPSSSTHYYCDDSKDKEYVRDNAGREDYLDFYCCGTEGAVPEWVEQKMNSLGYTKSPWPDKE